MSNTKAGNVIFPLYLSPEQRRTVLQIASDCIIKYRDDSTLYISSDEEDEKMRRQTKKGVKGIAESTSNNPK
ncbi:hypothetical protein KUTeg_014614 [Tegillarca granosa]|uniref:Uncharacterized protein n=1 Tax=Tegillarca granosa TaxID=220873 RepID=A0ABQ9EU04_TEGGR|nr:hypothetical protein KUTeg_014614 [Tegillarca granosa]